MRILPELPRQRAPWQARLLALALGLLGPAILLTSVQQGMTRRAMHAAAHDATERIVALDLPAVLRDERMPPLAPSGIVPSTSPARDRATSGAGPMPAFPSFPARADSSSVREPAGAATARVPRPRELFRAPAAGGALCLPPGCGTRGATVASGAGGGAGPGLVFPPMTTEERDSIARAVITAAAAAGGSESRPASGLPPGAVGVSLPVGLPGGGPTRAQRERARVLDADVSARLARIRARTDSIVAARRRDSVARAMPRSDDEATAPGA